MEINVLQEPGTSRDTGASDNGDQATKVKDMYHDANSDGSSAFDSNDMGKSL